MPDMPLDPPHYVFPSPNSRPRSLLALCLAAITYIAVVLCIAAMIIALVVYSGLRIAG